MVRDRQLLQNPFSVTKADDFSDEEIRDFWVDYQDGGGFESLFAPHELMPKLFLGGKGSGKTHFMRYFSFSLQKIRAEQRSVLDQVQIEGYLGIYMICGGLDANRFSGKGQPSDTWRTLFSYYMDLRLASHTLDVLESLRPTSLDLSSHEADICHEIIELFDRLDARMPNTYAELRTVIRGLQSDLDNSVNNSAISRHLDISIRATPGRLVFGIPEIVAKRVTALARINFIYLIDELENISKEQQQYVNTLIRERRAPVTFRLGARSYGIRTYATLAANEDNQPGSEFDLIILDEYLRKAEKEYQLFARRLVASRLARAGIRDARELIDLNQLDRYFETPKTSKLRTEETQFVTKQEGERKYFLKLRSQLLEARKRGIATGLEREADVEEVLSLLRIPDAPLLEKMNCLLIYRSLFHKEKLIEAARVIKADCVAFKTTESAKVSKYGTEFQHFANDLFLQLCREYDQRVLYVGLNEIIRMSDGLPRSLLIVLKGIYRWAVFGGEKPFISGPISTRAQERGVLEGSEWFYRNAPSGGGQKALDALRGVERLAELFRELLYSDKPPECSLITFAANVGDAGQAVADLVQTAEKFSMLVRIQSGQKDKNTGRVDDKFQLNLMLAPRWSLPLARRGAISLNKEELISVFSPTAEGDFSNIKAKRLSRANFPFELNALNHPGTRGTLSLFDNTEHD